jgi:hypothetical protein
MRQLSPGPGKHRQAQEVRAAAENEGATAVTPQIRKLLAQWAAHRIASAGNLPPELVRVSEEIGRLAPESARVIELEYCDPRPQKTKAAQLCMSRQMFSARLRWIHEQLAFSLWGNSVS